MDAKTKIWIKDRFTIYDYQEGDLVTVIRKNAKGYPNKLVPGTFYVVKRIDGEALELIKEDDPKLRAKAHYSYLMKKNLYLQYLRDDRLSDILGDLSV